MPIHQEPERLPNVEIITFRLNELEKIIERDISKIIDRLDTLIEKINQSELEQASMKTKIEKLESEVRDLKKSDAKHKDELTKVKVSIAEKLTWGAAGGGVVSIITSFLQSGAQ
jgi:dsDNA-specific endonuclease/ATPase MutS2